MTTDGRLQLVPMRRKGWIPGRYAFRIAWPIALESALVLSLIEGVFLAEKLAGILEDAIAAKMTASQIGVTLLATAPEILDLALPAALLIAVYRVVIRLREDSELVVIASAGIGAQALLVLLLGLAVPGLLASLLVSGFVEPHSRFLQRKILFDSAYGALRDGTATGEFHFAQGYTAFADPESRTVRQHQLFLHRSLDSATDRVVLAKQFRLLPEGDGWFTLRLQDFAVYDFPSPRGLVGQGADGLPPAEPRMGSMRIGNFQQDLAVNSLIYFAPRTSASEQTLTELIAGGSWSESMLRIFKSLLCLLAPISALLGVTFTGRRSMFVALPGAVLVLMSVDVGGTALLRGAMAPYPVATALALTALTPISLLLLGRLVVARQDKLLKSALGG